MVALVSDINLSMRIDHSTEMLIIATCWKNHTGFFKGNKCAVSLAELQRFGPGGAAEAIVMDAMRGVPMEVREAVMRAWDSNFNWVEDTRLTDAESRYMLVEREPGPRGYETFRTPSAARPVLMEEAPPERRFPETARPVLVRFRAEVEMCEDPLQQSRLQAILEDLERLAPQPIDDDQEDEAWDATHDPSSRVSSAS